MPKVIKHWEGEILDVDPWIAAGKPEMWVIQDTYPGYKLYQDFAYGALALTGSNGVVIGKGKDFVSNGTKSIIGLGPYYTDGTAAIYVRTDRVLAEKVKDMK
jgi:hypothetical protein